MSAAVLGAIAGCGGPPAALAPDGGRPSQLGSADNMVAFEGQHAFVTLVHASVDLSSAVISLPPELVLRDFRCDRSACAIVASVLDTTPSTGTPIPPPIDAMVRQIVLETDSHRVTATLNVMPLDQIRNVGSAAQVEGTYFASSLEATDGAAFMGAVDGAPIRWLVFGDVLLAGSVDVSATAAIARCGGLDGGPVGGGATGEGAGLAGEGGGSGTGGLDPEGGAGGDAWGPGCAADFFAVDCGGGGGGGDASSVGGGGAGAFALVSLGHMTFEGTVVARGGDGAGGGGGGRVLISAVDVRTAPDVDVAGGTGAGGANGGQGELTGPGPGVDFETSLAMELDLARYIRDTPEYVLVGTAAAGSMLRAETTEGIELGSVIADTSGAFSLQMMLPSGFSRVRVFATDPDGTERRLFIGNHVELERRTSRTQPQPIGGLIDIVYLAGD